MRLAVLVQLSIHLTHQLVLNHDLNGEQSRDQNRQCVQHRRQHSLEVVISSVIFLLDVSKKLIRFSTSNVLH